MIFKTFGVGFYLNVSYSLDEYSIIIILQVSQSWEGPFGVACSSVYHNETDNTPTPRPLPQWLIEKRTRRKVITKQSNKEEKKIKSWHERVSTQLYLQNVELMK